MARKALARHSGLIASLVAFSVAVAGCGGGSKSSSTADESRSNRVLPVRASAAGLRTVARIAGHPIYWATLPAPATYELTQTKAGRTYIRYLPAGVRVGDPRASFLTVGTYPQKAPLEAVLRASKRPGAGSVKIPGGGLLVSFASRPTSVFFALPESAVLVEVFDPRAGRAASLVRSGVIAPIS